MQSHFVCFLNINYNPPISMGELLGKFPTVHKCHWCINFIVSSSIYVWNIRWLEYNPVTRLCNVHGRKHFLGFNPIIKCFYEINWAKSCCGEMVASKSGYQCKSLAYKFIVFLCSVSPHLNLKRHQFQYG